MLTQNEAVSPPKVSGVDGNIFVSVEMSRLKWVIGLHTPLADKIAIHTFACGDVVLSWLWSNACAQSSRQPRVPRRP